MVLGGRSERGEEENEFGRGFASPSHTHKTHACTHACMRGEERKRKERKRGERVEKFTSEEERERGRRRRRGGGRK